MQLDALVNFGMLALVIWEYLVKFAGMQPMDVYNLGQYGIQMESIVQSAFAGELLMQPWPAVDHMMLQAAVHTGVY